MKTQYLFKNIFFVCLTLFFCKAGVAQNQDQGGNHGQGKVIAYSYPRISPKSPEYTLHANGQDVFVYQTSAEPFAAFSCNGSTDIDIEMPREKKNIAISPFIHGITPVTEGNHLKFHIPGPMNLAVKVDGMPVLYIYANPIAENKPNPEAPGIRYFKAGQVYEVGDLHLHDHDTLYIEGGAVVRGCIRATSSKNVNISGYGILDGGFYTYGIDNHCTIVFEDCQNSSIEGITIIEPTSWTIMLGLCKNVRVSHVKEMASIISTDGVDIIGSSHILVENCMFRNGDDCIAVKSINMTKHGKDATLNYAQNVEDIEIRNCAFISYIGGQALEIGHELRCESVSNIRFHDCDILGVHGQGGILGIHNADRATVSNVLYENIRVEHFYNKLVDFRIIKSRWSESEERGQIRNVMLKNIDVKVVDYNGGYSISLIGGYDSSHTIENITFDHFLLNGVKVGTADQLDLYIKDAKNIIFK